MEYFFRGLKADAIYSLALSETGDLYVTGGTNSINFPVLNNAYQPSLQDSTYPDAFVTKISIARDTNTFFNILWYRIIRSILFC